ncbi:MAG: hypothetical protein KatS3mg077_0370 [Candidatus Binatia bacterium]|nr:MAG: hypothetical protein KatS3mg077_0370 [Candidatus Binatia bacterium]
MLARALGLDDGQALCRIGPIVHFLNASGMRVPVAAGVAAVLAGWRATEPAADTRVRGARAVVAPLGAGGKGVS